MKILKWGLIAFVGLTLLGAVAGEDDKSPELKQASASAPASSPETAPEVTPETTPEATPEPKPETRVDFDGPFTVRKDTLTLRGTVEPKNANVRVRGKAAKVRNGRWTMPVTLSKKGDSSFRVLATLKGHVRSTTRATVTRELSAAERAAIRAAKALARANRRALESAESYLSHSAFSKKGLYEQLLYEEFTESEASYAVDHVGADWNEQAAKSAKSYLSHSSFSKQGLIEQLLYEGFTQEQATYGVNKAY